MIIRRKNANCKKPLDSVRPGETFELGVSIYMRVTNQRNSMAITSINLNNGEVVRLRYDTEVTPFKAELVEV